MIGVEQWRASIGLYHSRSHRQLTRVPGKRQLAPIPCLPPSRITVLVLILTEQFVCSMLFVIWILVNGHSLLKGGLTSIMASKKSSQLLVSVCAIGQAVTEAISGCLERSVRAMAILLIMAGDVEENPGPLPPASASPESRALRHHSASLITAIADPLRLSWKLYSAGILRKPQRTKLTSQEWLLRRRMMFCYRQSWVGWTQIPASSTNLWTTEKRWRWHSQVFGRETGGHLQWVSHCSRGILWVQGSVSNSNQLCKYEYSNMGKSLIISVGVGPTHMSGRTFGASRLGVKTHLFWCPVVLRLYVFLLVWVHSIARAIWVHTLKHAMWVASQHIEHRQSYTCNRHFCVVKY